jgi:hypothetical protein
VATPTYVFWASFTVAALIFMNQSRLEPNS